MSLSGLGLNTALLGVGELTGTLASAWGADRFGKRSCAIAGIALLVPGCAALSLVGHGAAAGVGLLVAIAVGFELSWVSALPLLTEIAPQERAATLGAFFAASTVSRAVSSAVSGWLYTWGGITAIGFTAAGVAALILVTLVLGVSEPSP
jgi:predicted MFS family arabinose efflux permease